MDAQRAAAGLHRVLRRARPHPGAVGRADPAPPDRADVHQRRDEPVRPRTSSARSRRPTAGPRRCRSAFGRGKHNDIDEHRRHPPPPHVLRDARQLQLRRLLQGRGHPLGLGAASPRSLGLDPDRLWVTVHLGDDEAEAIWRDAVGVPPERIQRLGEDNFWEMGETGPCGPCSEIFFDFGPELRRRGRSGHGGGPSATSRSGTSCSCSTTASPTGRCRPADQEHRHRRRPGAHWPMVQGVPTVFDTDVLGRCSRPQPACTGRRLRRATQVDRQPARPRRPRPDHDVPRQRRRVPVQRGPGLRAAPHHPPGGAPRLTARRRDAGDCPSWSTPRSRSWATPTPTCVAPADWITGVVGREEERFRQTLRAGSAHPRRGARLPAGGTLPGDVAFQLHDTYGFPLELTQEVAAERGVEVDVAGFEAAMGPARRAKSARKAAGGTDGDRRDAYRRLLDEFGADRVHRLRGGRDGGQGARRAPRPGGDGDGTGRGVPRPHAVLRRARRPGRRHRHDHRRHRPRRGARHDLRPARPAPAPGPAGRGRAHPGQEATASDRRRPARRHPPQPHRHPPAALGPARGAGRARQAAGLAGGARLPALRLQPPRGASTPDELREVEELVNAEVLANEPVRPYETTKEEAERDGRHRLLRRQVRRGRACGRGRPPLARAVRRHPRRALGDDRPHPDRSARARSAPTSAASSPPPARPPSTASARSWPPWAGPPPCSGVPPPRCSRGSRSSSTSSTRPRRRGPRPCARQGASAGPASWPPRPSTASSSPASTARPGTSCATWRWPSATSPASGPSCWAGAGGRRGRARGRRGQGQRLQRVGAARRGGPAVGGGGGKQADIAIAGGRDPSRLDRALDLARAAATALMRHRAHRACHKECNIRA